MSNFIKNKNRSIFISISFGLLLSFSILFIRANRMSIGAIDTPKVIRDGNVDMFGQAVLKNSILQGFLLILGLFLIILILHFLMHKNRILFVIISIAIIAFSVLISINYSYSNKDVGKEIFGKNSERKAESFFNDIINEEYDSLCSNYVNSQYYNSFISKNLYSQTMKRIYRRYGSEIELKETNTYSVSSYTIITFTTVHNNDTTVYYHIAFNSLNKISGFYITRYFEDYNY